MPPTRTLDDRIDRLYQLPLDEFTSARNALAKELAAEGGPASDVKKLTKPPAAAWAINQVHWSRRAVFDAFLASASALRDAHADMLAGKRADLRAAGAAHEESLEAVLKAALAALKDAGHPPTDATKQAIATTLRALPGANERPGRLATLLQPRGFEMLAGMPAAPAAKPAPRPPSKPATKEPASKDEKADARARAAERARALAKARDALADATKTEKAAAQAVRQEEFEAARSHREVERAQARLADARAALDAAQQAVDDAEQEVSEAAKTRDATARRVRDASDALARARVRSQTVQAEIERLQP